MLATRPPTLSMISAWYEPNAVCASACFGSSLIAVASASLILPPKPCASAFVIEMPWL
jgi:hypothetical protein